jgi:hypothetical protein
MSKINDAMALLPEQKIRHVYYEIWMLLDSVHYLASNPPLYDKLMINAIIESSLVHARNLIGFFSRKGGHATDINVEDFDAVISGISDRVIPLFLGHPSEERIHGEICHLTVRRYENLDRKRWTKEEILGPLLPALIKFLEEVQSCPTLMAVLPRDDFARLVALASYTPPFPELNISWASATSSLDSDQATFVPSGSVDRSISIDGTAGSGPGGVL